MLNTQSIKDSLTIKNIFNLMDHLEASPYIDKNNDDIIHSQTICHDGDSHKLYYYDNNKTFVCYTNCGSFDIFQLIQKVKDIDFKESLKWVESFFNLSNSDKKIDTKNQKFVDFEAKVEQQLKYPEITKLPLVSSKILKSYDNIAYIDWIRQGITPKVLNKFHIKLDIPGEQIIIPEYDHNNRLIGVRSRHLDKDSLKVGRKYTPLNHKGKELKYPTGQILYGFNFNKAAINRYHKMILFEAEKSVMKMDSYLGDKNIAVGLCGSNLTSTQINIIQRYTNVDEVIVALDKEFKHPFTKMERIYAEQIKSEFARLNSFCHVSIVWDIDDSLNYKDSPIDDSFKTFKHLTKHRIFPY